MGVAPDGFGARKAGDARERFIHVEDGSAHVGNDDALARVTEDTRGQTHFFLGLVAFGDVAGNQNEAPGRAPRGIHRRYRQLEPALPLFQRQRIAQAIGIALADRLVYRLLADLGHGSGHHIGKPPPQKHLRGRCQQITAMRVVLVDASFAVNFEQQVGKRIQHGLQPPLVRLLLAQHALCQG